MKPADLAEQWKKRTDAVAEREYLAEALALLAETNKAAEAAIAELGKKVSDAEALTLAAANQAGTERGLKELAEKNLETVRAERDRLESKAKLAEPVLDAARPVAKARGAASESAQVALQRAVEDYDRLSGLQP